MGNILTNGYPGYGLLIGICCGVIIGIMLTYGRFYKDNSQMWHQLAKMSGVWLCCMCLSGLIGQFTLKSHEFGFFVGAGGMVASGSARSFTLRRFSAKNP